MEGICMLSPEPFGLAQDKPCGLSSAQRAQRKSVKGYGGIAQ